MGVQSETVRSYHAVLNPLLRQAALADALSEPDTELVNVERKVFAIGNNKAIVL